ncbi:signal transduction histidine kinase [Marinilabilia salmonicolor]|jgi:signal transduction histidine kinase|uniref:sensor histidine kinase n=1 Tax=Marinilabilia salmonicolor TaxID=989 RepID=UPI000D070F61|nr:ATP-binding protein [Marinilabilia salmonicolor]PRY99789.1 signal transduction histidine kinase [Marinilabilia salmonicolor]
MSLIEAISNIFKSKDSFPKEPSDFFSGDKTTEFIERLNAKSPRAIGLSPLDALTLKICEISQAEYIIVAKTSEEEGYFKTISICNQTNPIQNNHFSFKINALLKHPNPDTPVEVDAEVVFSQTNLPKSKHGNCIALQIRDNDKTPMGIILGISKPSRARTLTNVIKFYSDHLTTEMRHLNSKEKLEKKNKKLLRTEEELKLKNQLLDNLNKNISKAKQVVDESSRLKSAFLANLSHEIRTPMNVIMGFTELLSAANMTSEQRRNYIDIIQQNGTRLLHIMDSLIDISRFQAKNIGKEQQAFSLNQMLQQLYNNFNADIEASGKPITLTLTLSKNHGEDVIVLDKEATYKVLNHLLDNAVKFTASGTIRFGYEIKEKQILFHVEDTGIGIPEGKEKEIFDLFRQGDLRLSRQFGGTGLGLAIAKRYVSAMNGQIWCSNNQDSARGATFKFSLPLLAGSKNRTETLSQKSSGALTVAATTMISNESLL